MVEGHDWGMASLHKKGFEGVGALDEWKGWDKEGVGGKGLLSKMQSLRCAIVAPCCSVLHCVAWGVCSTHYPTA